MNAKRAGAAALAATMVVLAGCVSAAGPTASPTTPTPTAEPSPTPEPTATPRPTPTVPPTDDPSAEIPIPSTAEAVEEVEALALPAGDQPVATLGSGDEVTVHIGPVVLDDAEWYLVAGSDTQWTGWVPGETLQPTGEPSEHGTVLSVHGAGDVDTASSEIDANAQLYVSVMAAPVEDSSCEIAVVLTGTDGEPITINAADEIDAPTMFFASPLENSALRQGEAGTIELSVETDCSFAGIVEAR